MSPSARPRPARTALLRKRSSPPVGWTPGDATRAKRPCQHPDVPDCLHRPSLIHPKPPHMPKISPTPTRKPPDSPPSPLGRLHPGPAVARCGQVPRPLSSVGQSTALVKRRSSVRIRQGAHLLTPDELQLWLSGGSIVGLGQLVRGRLRERTAQESPVAALTSWIYATTRAQA